jgi:hypothetical protein
VERGKEGIVVTFSPDVDSGLACALGLAFAGHSDSDSASVAVDPVRAGPADVAADVADDASGRDYLVCYPLLDLLRLLDAAREENQGGETLP